MIVKTFVGETFSEACQRISDELGSDAIVIRTRKVRVGGFLGFFGRWVFEVIAQAHASRAATPREATAPAPALSAPPLAPPENVPPAVVSPANLEPPPAPATREPSAGDLGVIRAELEDLKQKMDLLVSLHRSAPPDRPMVGAERLAPARQHTVAFSKMVDRLVASGLEPNVSARIRTHLLETGGSDDFDDPARLESAVIDYLSRQLVAHKGIEVAHDVAQRVVMLIGPTGAGKTTTLAKLCAGLKFNLDADVAFLTLDTFRIAAAEQLRHYGAMIEVPTEVVFQSEGLAEAIHRFSDKDVILIDTPGRNPLARAEMLELERFLDCGVPVEPYLVLSANMKYADLVEAATRFGALSPKSLILTKTDETTECGSVISLLLNSKLGVSYLTNGQNVPADIVPASPAKLARLLFTSGYNTASQA